MDWHRGCVRRASSSREPRDEKGKGQGKKKGKRRKKRLLRAAPAVHGGAASPTGATASNRPADSAAARRARLAVMVRRCARARPATSVRRLRLQTRGRAAALRSLRRSAFVCTPAARVHVRRYLPPVAADRKRVPCARAPDAAEGRRRAARLCAGSGEAGGGAPQPQRQPQQRAWLRMLLVSIVLLLQLLLTPSILRWRLAACLAPPIGRWRTKRVSSCRVGSRVANEGASSLLAGVSRARSSWLVCGCCCCWWMMAPAAAATATSHTRATLVVVACDVRLHGSFDFSFPSPSSSFSSLFVCLFVCLLFAAQRAGISRGGERLAIARRDDEKGRTEAQRVKACRGDNDEHRIGIAV